MELYWIVCKDETRDTLSQLLNIIIMKFNSPVLLNQLSNIFLYRSSSTGSVLENILPVELWVYFTVNSQ